MEIWLSAICSCPTTLFASYSHDSNQAGCPILRMVKRLPETHNGNLFVAPCFMYWCHLAHTYNASETFQSTFRRKAALASDMGRKAFLFVQCPQNSKISMNVFEPRLLPRRGSSLLWSFMENLCACSCIRYIMLPLTSPSGDATATNHHLCPEACIWKNPEANRQN